MSSKLRELVQQYRDAQSYVKKSQVLKTEIIDLLKKEQLTKAKFNFGNQEIGYSCYKSFDSISQQLIKQVLNKHYPTIDHDKFIQLIKQERKSKYIETLNIKSKG